MKLVTSPGTRNLYSLPPLQEFWPGVFPKPRESFALWEKVGPGLAHGLRSVFANWREQQKAAAFSLPQS